MSQPRTMAQAQKPLIIGPYRFLLTWGPTGHLEMLIIDETQGIAFSAAVLNQPYWM